PASPRPNARSCSTASTGPPSTARDPGSGWPSATRSSARPAAAGRSATRRSAARSEVFSQGGVQMADFAQTITTAYATDGAALDLGRGVHDGAVVTAATVKLPLRMVNRHGLIAGATGTGKTKTLQGIAEQLSSAGVPVFVADVKGDLSGVAEPGDAGGAAAKRAQDLGLQFQARGFPVEFFALGGICPGIPIRATVSDFGPQLLAKVLGANDTQEQSLTLVFHYADAKGLPLLDLSDLRALLTFLASDAGKADLTGIGGLSSATVGVLLRSLTGLEDGG